MQTSFTSEQLARPEIAHANDILRKCVHCGFCNSTCPTFDLLGDELDGPRGRIYLIKDLLENDTVPGKEVVKHLDRCLSCLSCMTTCPSAVNYMHLVDTGRARIEAQYRRPLQEQLLRGMLAHVLTRPILLRLLLMFSPLLRAVQLFLPDNLKQAVTLTRVRHTAHTGNSVTVNNAEQRVGLLTGCVQSVLGSGINQATENILHRHGIATIDLDGCCGAVEQHLGKSRLAVKRIAGNVTSWPTEGLEAVIANASGCGTLLKDYGHLLQQHPAAERAGALAGMSRDICEYLDSIELRFSNTDCHGIRVAYHSACSMQHGQKVHRQPMQLLARAGFTVLTIPGGHLCCGSAGTYNLLQPELARQLAQNKADHVNALSADVMASGNLGCMLQLREHINIPVVHTVELLDWACGGEKPPGLTC